MSDSSNAFFQLDKGIQRFIWEQKWESLRDIQEMSIPVVLPGDKDVIIAASTASGKTEAAFLPALTKILKTQGLIVYISPLKALINDQFGRLGALCEDLEIPVWPWHGDISRSVKDRFYKNRRGVLLITPESIEAMLCNRGSSIGAIFSKCDYVIIDELHAFMGSERGKQLQSLLHRIERIIGKKVVRVGLSATLGDMNMAAHFMRPGFGQEVVLLEAPGQRLDLDMKFKGYEEPSMKGKAGEAAQNRGNPIESSTGDDLDDDDLTSDAASECEAPPIEDSQTPELQPTGLNESAGSTEVQEIPDSEPTEHEESSFSKGDVDNEVPQHKTPGSYHLIAQHIFLKCADSNNLVFPNSRSEVERFTNLLNALCKQHKIPNRFWPHHGSLSKDIRAETEAALKQKERPASAVCTNTLELGIDIGAVKSVAQIGPPGSVSSLRQRLGRSGRRKGEKAILWGYCMEQELDDKSPIDDKLRVNLLQSCAMVYLLFEGWYEPPAVSGQHYSTLVQQMLSFIAQNGGATLQQLYLLLCDKGCPFEGVSKKDFISLTRELAGHDLLVQDQSGVLLHGVSGEQFVNHYTFYAAFATDEEYRIVANGKMLGSLPVAFTLVVGQRLLFAGKTWVVLALDEKSKTISVKRSRGGAPPMFVGKPAQVHTKVHQKMRELLKSQEPIPFLDETASRLFSQARETYVSMNLEETIIIDSQDRMLIFTWLGDAANETLSCLINSTGATAVSCGPFIEVSKCGILSHQIMEAVLSAKFLNPEMLDAALQDALNLEREKWDWALPEELLRKSYISLHLDPEGARQWVLESEEKLMLFIGDSAEPPFDDDEILEEVEESEQGEESEEGGIEERAA